LLVQTDDWLILPQVPCADGSDTPDRLARMAMIDDQVRRRWPDHTFTAAQAAAFVAELGDPATRYDGLHRNARGQAVEARHIGRWIAAHW
jgi:hypothetical protein